MIETRRSALDRYGFRRDSLAPMNPSTTKNPAHGTVRRPSKEKL
jgi:hypothetical protein